MKLNRMILVLMISGLVLATTGCNNEVTETVADDTTEQKEQSEDLVADENSSVGVEENRDTTEQSTQSAGRNENQATENRNTGNNSRPSNTTSNSNTSNTSAPSRNPATEAPAPSTTTTPSTATPNTTAAHTHNWKTVHHEEVGHYESVLVQEEFRNPIYAVHVLCSHCDFDYTANGLIPGPGVHICADGTKAAGYGDTSVYDHDQVFPAVYEDRWVVDTPAYDEQICSTCGQKK